MNRRIRLLALVLPVLVAGVSLLAWSQTWVTVALVGGPVVEVSGDAAAPAVPPFALAALALVGALALAGPVFRVVLGLLQALLGLGIVVSGSLAAADPVAASAVRLTEATGIDGVTGLRPLVERVVVSPWPGVAIAAGIAGIVIGIFIALTASRWPERTRRYDAVRLGATTSEVDAPIGANFSADTRAGADHRVDRLDAWDALSDGDDPTTR